MKAAGRRRKGSNGEREIVGILNDHGLPARRVPLSGAMSKTGFGGDVLVKDGGGEATWEIKRRGQGFKRIVAWMTEATVVAFRADRGDWCVCMRLEDYLRDRGLRPTDGAEIVPGPPLTALGVEDD